MFFGAVAVSLVAVIGVGIGGLIRHTAGAATILSLVIIGGRTVGQFLPAGGVSTCPASPPRRP